MVICCICFSVRCYTNLSSSSLQDTAQVSRILSKTGHDIKPPFCRKGTINIHTLQTKKDAKVKKTDRKGQSNGRNRELTHSSDMSVRPSPLNPHSQDRSTTETLPLDETVDCCNSLVISTGTETLPLDTLVRPL